MPSKKRKALIEQEFINKYGFIFKVIGYDENNRFTRIIKFDSGLVKSVNVVFIKNGCNFYDEFNTPTVNGVGIMDVKNGSSHLIYLRWANMLGRCYNEKHSQYDSYGRLGVTVEPYLYRFSNYINFISGLENYNKLTENPNNYQIDKDIKIGRIKTYNRETISIVKSEENLLEENISKMIPAYQYDLDYNLINKFNSITDAERSTGISRGNIARNIRKEGKSAGGYIWVSSMINK